MKHKIFSFFAAVAITAGLFSATPTMPAKAATQEDYKAIINACAVAFKYYRMGDKGAYLRKFLDGAPKEARPILEVTCASYGKGYYDALKDVNLHIV